MSQIIIGLAGKKQVGKDTAANYLAQGFGFEKIAFGDFVKKEVREILKDFAGINYSDKNKEQFRTLLQAWGDVRRFQNPNYWIEKLFSEIEKSPKIIISDCRFIKEIEEIKKRGGLIFKIERNTPFKDSHPSENEIDFYQFYDAVIDNNGTIEDLYKKLDEIAKKFHFN